MKGDENPNHPPTWKLLSETAQGLLSSTRGWPRTTGKTCNEPWIHPPDNVWARHVARPYHCQFADFQTMELGKLASWIKGLITGLTTQNLTHAYHSREGLISGLTTQHLTPEEEARSEQRKIKILLWDYRTEEEILQEIPGPEIDFSLGIPGGLTPEEGIIFHNAANDAVAEIVAFVPFMVITREDWKIWFEDKEHLDPMSMDWIDPTFWGRNWARAKEPAAASPASESEATDATTAA
ncbi:hypothetical protein B0T20DRAFT_477582 [Sordaria brevicollis]|uniref:Uncharacterized protein n=1 Tax=Sordaria brevicollis TaxID=83679 RepID=A0AAE0UD23_SORBR|nr:hypothetical protein B0T20DRAFT_477582 [Sordaria brevicollis]